MDIPEIRYARAIDELHIAYQVVGHGSVDLVFVPPWISVLDIQWENEEFARFLRRLTAFCRLIVFDKRGTGLSDRVSNERVPDLETRMDDVRAVMDGAGSDRAAILGLLDGGHLAALFAAANPERTSALILWGSRATCSSGVSWPNARSISPASTLRAASSTVPPISISIRSTYAARRLSVLRSQDGLRTSVIERPGANPGTVG